QIAILMALAACLCLPLVTRLCLGTHCPEGSALSSSAHTVSVAAGQSRGGAVGTVRSQAKPGNEESPSSILVSSVFHPWPVLFVLRLRSVDRGVAGVDLDRLDRHRGHPAVDRLYVDQGLSGA